MHCHFLTCISRLYAVWMHCVKVQSDQIIAFYLIDAECGFIGPFYCHKLILDVFRICLCIRYRNGIRDTKPVNVVIVAVCYRATQIAVLGIHAVGTVNLGSESSFFCHDAHRSAVRNDDDDSI